MSNLLARMKTYNFWISFVSAIILVLRIIGDKFNFFVDATLIMDITTGLCGIFVVLGIISAPSGKKENGKVEQTEQNGIGRFEQVQALHEAENTKSIENATGNTYNLEPVEEVEEIEVDFKTVEENVEKPAEIVEKIQEEIEKCENDKEIEVDVIQEKSHIIENDSKAEIAELLTILLDKINNL